MDSVLNYIEPFKNREVDFSKYVYVYRCLNKRSGCYYSIKQNGLVVGHTEYLHLLNCKFISNKHGKQKYLETGIKNVHAFIKGYLSENINFNVDDLWDVWFDSNSETSFISNFCGVNKSIHEADEVIIIKNKVKMNFLKVEPLPNNW